MGIFSKFITVLGWIAFVILCLIVILIIYIAISNKLSDLKRKKHLEKVRKETLMTKQEEVHKTDNPP